MSKQNSTFLTSKNNITGALACCAVRLSPYTMPIKLQEGLLEFNKAFGPCPAFNPISNSEYFETDCPTLLGAIRFTFEKCPTIMSWNEAKRGSGIVVISRYHAPEADYACINLDVLARNIAHLITLEAKYTQQGDNDDST